MMTLKQAIRLITGTVVHDMSGRKLRVGDYTITFDKGEPINAYFKCFDVNDPSWHFNYQYNEIYESFEDLSDEDKSFIKWIRNEGKKQFAGYMYSDEIKELRDPYIAGFVAGFEHRKQMSAQEQLQK